MAEETKTTQTAEKTVAESTAFDSDGKIKPGYQYRYETVQNADGKRETRKVVTKRG